jgi:phosphomannomutase/phosphomannomutase/phosphoglucomutase
MGEYLACFKAYDVRGRVPDELNEALARRIGRACADFLLAEKGLIGTDNELLRVVVGRDIRLSSAALCTALGEGLRDGGADVLDIGLCGTEMVYFATFQEGADGGIMVTASHNPMDFNGLKLVRAQARPISSDSGLSRIEAMAAGEPAPPVPRRGDRRALDISEAFSRHVLSYVDAAVLRRLKVVVNAGNGGAGMVVDLLESHLPFEFIKVHHEPDGHFPNGIPNPLLSENRGATVEAIRAHGADVGIAWDGDFDRCFFFDERGCFIEGYYLVGLLAQSLLENNPGARIIHDPRLTWNTLDVVHKAGGVPVQSKTGHAFIKERMRAEDAVYGGEMSAHHYFRDFAYCDSGTIPWLLVLERMCRSGKPLSALVEERVAAYPCSGEINFRVNDPVTSIDKVLAHYRDRQPELDYTDGVSVAFSDWRFNLRMSNTEPLLRLNVESCADRELMQRRTDELRRLITDA